MSLTGAAALIAAVSIAVLAAAALYAAIRLGGLMRAVTTLIRDAGAEHESVIARVNAAVDRTTVLLDQATGQLDRTEALTGSMDKLGEGMRELAGQVSAVSEFGKTVAGAIVTGPAGKAAAFAYGIRHAVGLRNARRRALPGEIIERAEITRDVRDRRRAAR